MIKKNLCLLVLLLSGSLLVCKGLGKIQEEKLNYNTLYADENNALWIGTDVGLLQWKNTGTSKVLAVGTLNITAINSMKECLIFGTNEGKIYTYNTSTKKLSYIADMKAEISDIQKKEDKICIASKGNGYVIITPYEILFYSVQHGLKDNFIYKLFLDKDQSIWCSSDMGINVVFKEKPIELFFNHLIPDRLVTCFAKRDSILYCGTQLGDICKINLIDSTILLFDNTIWDGGQENKQINDIKILDKSIVIATNYGAFQLDLNGRLLETIVSNKGIDKIEVDKEANLWFCGDHILVSSTGEQISRIRTINESTISNIHTLYIDDKQTIYFTPDQGLVKYNTVTNCSQKTNITSPSEMVDILCMYLDPYGKLWIGTSGKGLYIVDTATLLFSHIPIDSSVETSDILSVTGDRETIWIASLNGVWYSKINKGQYKFKSLEDEYKRRKYYVYQVKKDDENNLWLATDGQGVLKLSNGTITDFTTAKNIQAKVFYGSEKDALGQMWFDPSDSGLYCMKKDSLVHLTQGNGLSSNDIVSISKYKKDFMIAASAIGIDIINIHNFAVSHYNFELMHMPQTPEIKSITTDNHEMVYVGTNTGILEVYIPSYKTQFIPQACIEDILVMGKNSLRETNRFSYEENFFKFNISSYSNTEQPIFYRYKLRGLSEQWNQTNDKEATFPRLNPGSYDFILQSANNKDFFNATQDSFAFTILNPFWKQGWFILLMLSAFGVSFFYYIRFREKRISRVQQLEKEKAIAEFETLKHQVSPHFLFNSFNTLIQVIDEDKEKAIEYTQMLSDFYRSLISYRDVDLVTLKEELTLLDKYIYLQKMRFGDSLLLQNICSDFQIQRVEIPPLTLQLLAENAIKHNTISTGKPLTITIQMNNHEILIINNINEKFTKEPGENIGLENIKNRFKLFTKQEVQIIKTDHQFEVRLPILKPEKMDTI